MTRNLSLLALALMAALALGMTTASASFAYQPTFTATEGLTSVNLTGTGLGSPNEHRFTLGENSVICPTVHMSGTLPEASEKVTLRPTFECSTEITGLGKTITTVAMNECDFRFSVNEGEPGKDEYAGKLQIVCPKGKKIEILVYRNATEHSEGKTFCTVSIEEQTVGEGVNFVNDTTETPKDVTIRMSSVVFAEAKGDPRCGKEAKHEIIYHGTTTLQALNPSNASPVGLHVG